MNLKDLYLNNLKMYEITENTTYWGDFNKVIRTDGDNGIRIYLSGTAKLSATFFSTSTLLANVKGVLKDESGTIVAETQSGTISKNNSWSANDIVFPVQAFKKYTFEIVTTFAYPEMLRAAATVYFSLQIKNDSIFE